MKLKTTVGSVVVPPPVLRRIDYSRKRITTIFAKSNNNNNSQLNSGSSSDSPPPRITSNLKQNLHFLKLFKEFQKRNSSSSRPSTSYRRKKVVDNGPHSFNDNDDDDDDLSYHQDPTSSLYYYNHNNANSSASAAAAAPVLLVDGYNVCGYWLKLKKHFINGRLEIARHKLLLELVTFSALRQVKVVAVFDAMMSGLPSHKDNFSGVDVIFSADTCADTWIENEVAALKEDGCPKVWVVTSDHCQQQAAHGAGAFVWSCKALVNEIKSSHKEVERMLQEQRSTSFQGRLLKHNLDAEVVDALKNLRQKLSENDLK